MHMSSNFTSSKSKLGRSRESEFKTGFVCCDRSVNISQSKIIRAANNASCNLYFAREIPNIFNLQSYMTKKSIKSSREDAWARYFLGLMNDYEKSLSVDRFFFLINQSLKKCVSADFCGIWQSLVKILYIKRPNKQSLMLISNHINQAKMSLIWIQLGALVLKSMGDLGYLQCFLLKSKYQVA